MVGSGFCRFEIYMVLPIDNHHYLQHILDIEQSSFSPLVFSSVGGMAKEASIFYKSLAYLLAEK